MNIVKLVISFCDHCVLLCNKCAKCMGLYFSCFWMSSLDAFSPRLYVFVVCSICRRKKFIVLVERLIHSVVFGLGHDGTVLFVTFSVTSFLISRLCRWCSVSFFSLKMSHTKCWSCRTRTGWNIWQYYPLLDQIQSDCVKQSTRMLNNVAFS